MSFGPWIGKAPARMNPVLRTPPTTDPALALRYRDRQYAAELVAAAVLHLDFFTWLHRHPGVGTPELCEALGIVARPAHVLLTLARACGFVAADDGGGHRLTPLGAEHLVSDSPWFLGPYYAPLRDTPVVRSFLEVLRTGRPGNWQASAGGKDWHASMLDEEFAKGFTDLMNARGLALGQALARCLAPRIPADARLLDVAGGSGIYAATLVAAHPTLRAVVLEQPPVDALVRREIDRHGITDRVTVQSGDMFRAPWPESEVVLLSNVLHDWDVPEVRQLLARASAAVVPGGWVVIHDAFLDDDQSGPLPVAEYSALLANITQGRCYSAGEYGTWLREAGFEPGTYRPTLADRGYLAAVRRS